MESGNDAAGDCPRPPFRECRPLAVRRISAGDFVPTTFLIREIDYHDVHPFRPMSGMVASELPGTYPNPVEPVFSPTFPAAVSDVAGTAIQFTHAQYLSDGLSPFGTERLLDRISGTTYFVSPANAN